MSSKAQQIEDLVQSLFGECGDDKLVELKDHDIPCLLENIKIFISSNHHSESSVTMTDVQLYEHLDALFKNLHYLSRCRAKLIFPPMTQYELLQNLCSCLRDFHGLKVSGCIEHEMVDYFLPKFQLIAERVGNFCFELLSCQRDRRDEQRAVDGSGDLDEPGELDETGEPDEVLNESGEFGEAGELDESGDLYEYDEIVEIYEVDELNATNVSDEHEETNETDEIEDSSKESDEIDENEVSDESVETKLALLLLEISPVEMDVMHMCFTKLEASKSAEVRRLNEQLLEASPYILRECLLNLEECMIAINVDRTSAQNIHVMMEFLLIILTDEPKDVIHHHELFALMARIAAHTRAVSILVRGLVAISRSEEKMNEAMRVSIVDLWGSMELLKKDLKHIFLKAPEASQLRFPKSDGPLFVILLLRHLNDLLNSSAYSVVLIEKEIELVKEDLEFIKSSFGKIEQELNKDIWNRALDVAYEAQLLINSILVRDHGLLPLIFLLPDTVEKMKHLKEKIQENISKNKRSLVVANPPSNPFERNSSTKIMVGFKEETELIIKQLTSGPAGLDVISIIGMPGSGKTTLAYKIYNDKSVINHFDICAWCTVDQKYDKDKLLKNIYNQVTGSDNKFREDFDVYDELRRKLYGKRYLIVLDDLWDTEAWDELTMPFQDLQKGSRIILTSREKEVALHGKHHSDPLNLRLLRLEESWELLERRVFGEKCCPDELLDVGEEIAQKCKGLPLVLDLIIGVIAKEEKNKSFWQKVVDNLNSFVLKDDQEVFNVIQLSYDRLSDHLKPCLLYFSTYPKDEVFDIRKLKYLWKGEGLVEHCVDVSLDELISSSLVIVSKEGYRRELRYKIHDLVHDFCSIKAENEKLFEHLTNSSAALMLSSSFVDVMPRGMCIDQLDADFFMFNPEKKNPCAKHLLSLKVSAGGRLLNCHLRHLRLLRRLELQKITVSGSLLNEISTLIHLRFLSITTDAETLPLSFSNLLNLEILIVDRWDMVLSACIWNLAKLQELSISGCYLLDLDVDATLENLTVLSFPKITSFGIFKRFPNLQFLSFHIQNARDRSVGELTCFPRLDILDKLEHAVVSNYFNLTNTPENTHQWYFHFPTSLKILELKWFDLTSESLSRIARLLPNLQSLELYDSMIEEGNEWDMTGGITFENLKFLILERLFFYEWKVDAAESFPLLDTLHIGFCDELNEIPESFGDITSLQSITLKGSPQLEESARMIKEYVMELNGEDKLNVTCQ